MLRLARITAWSYIAVALAALLITLFIRPVGYAPLALRAAPAAEPVVVTIWYGTEKQAWLEAAAAQFAASKPEINGRPIEIRLVGRGSREIATRVAAQQWGTDTPPTAISPASSLQLELLRSDWEAQNPGAAPILLTGNDAPQPVVLTPLVLAVWDDRAQALWSGDQASFWQELHDAIVNSKGWAGHLRADAPADLRSRAETWGPVKFSHTSPLTSNSGMQALALLAYAKANKSRGLSTADLQNPELQAWLGDIERSIEQFGDSTGTFMDDMVRFGPSKYDLAAVYENVAIDGLKKAQNRWGVPLRVVYPPATLVSDHPFATLGGSWTTAEERTAANQFRRFLLSAPMQQLALQYGFRPADPNVSIQASDPSNPFSRYQQNGVRVDLPPQVETPSGETLNALLRWWQQATKH